MNWAADKVQVPVDWETVVDSHVGETMDGVMCDGETVAFRFAGKSLVLRNVVAAGESRAFRAELLPADVVFGKFLGCEIVSCRGNGSDVSECSILFKTEAGNFHVVSSCVSNKPANFQFTVTPPEYKIVDKAARKW